MIGGNYPAGLGWLGMFADGLQLQFARLHSTQSPIGSSNNFSTWSLIKADTGPTVTS